MTLWVDAASGDDENDGTESAPLRTVSGAVSRIPLVIDHDVHVKVRPGVYPESFSIMVLFGRQRAIKIEGTDWTQVTPRTGPPAGRFASTAGRHATVEGATWAADELKGRFVRILTGGHAGKCLVIVSNTADTIELCTAANPLSGAQFELVTPAAMITGAFEDAEAPVASIAGVGRGSGKGLSSVSLVNLSIDVLGQQKNGVWAAGGVDVYLDNVKISGNGTSSDFTGIRVDNGGGPARCELTDCVVFANARTDFQGAQAAGADLSATRCLFDGNGASSRIGVGVEHGTGALTDCVVQGFSKATLGHGCSAGESSVSFMGGVIRHCRAGVVASAGATFTLRGEIRECAGRGVVLQERARGVLDDGGAVRSNGSHGISLHGYGASLLLLGQHDVSRNGGHGVFTGGDPQDAFIDVTASAATTMNENTSGDFTTDGGKTSVGLTALRKLPGKVSVDQRRVIRLASG
ncbi:right-handed parallel beta-helix repeat-containing protein [Sorangium sp. So ce367]|uniref:right-handed parallel beta-helix repeat-containing protein n=1 Tax=Sorangium sp. So ce367 TaxID=3133305 RepID=UPI003F62510F